MSEIENEIQAAIRHANEPILVQIPRWMIDDVAELCDVRARRIESEARRCGEALRRSKHGLAHEWWTLGNSLRAQKGAQK